MKKREIKSAEKSITLKKKNWKMIDDDEETVLVPEVLDLRQLMGNMTEYDNSKTFIP